MILIFPWEYVIINEVLLILLCFILFYLFIYIYLKVIFLRDVTMWNRENIDFKC